MTAPTATRVMVTELTRLNRQFQDIMLDNETTTVVYTLVKSTLDTLIGTLMTLADAEVLGRSNSDEEGQERARISRENHEAATAAHAALRKIICTTRDRSTPIPESLIRQAVDASMELSRCGFESGE